MDVGVGKRISLTERTSLQFRSEFFNIFNHPQYGLPQATFGVPGFGSIIQTVNNDAGQPGRLRNSARDTVLGESAFLRRGRQRLLFARGNPRDTASAEFPRCTLVCGSPTTWVDSTGTTHRFLLSGRTYSSIDAPGAILDDPAGSQRSQ
jgi:hypothetical protein